MQVNWVLQPRFQLFVRIVILCNVLSAKVLAKGDFVIVNVSTHNYVPRCLVGTYFQFVWKN